MTKTTAIFSLIFISWSSLGFAAETASLSKRESVQLWKTLIKLDPKKKETPKEVSALLGKEITVAGFLIQNEAENMDDLKEFMITPVSGGCIHVPPPPPNYIIHVKVATGKKVKMMWGLVEVTGKLSLTKKAKDKEMYGYEMVGSKIEDINRLYQY